MAHRLLSSRAATAVVSDVAGRRDASHGSVTSSSCFVRFQGNELHASDAARLDAWTLELRHYTGTAFGLLRTLA